MKKEEITLIKFFSSKTQMVLYIFLFILFMAGFIYFGTRDYNNDVLDSQRFVEEHPGANHNNVFKYRNASEALSIIKSKNAVILVGIINSEYVTYYANMLDSVAKSLEIDSIDYYDITIDRKENNATYESIVNYFNDYVVYLDDKTADLYGPTLIIKKDGEIIMFDDDSALIKSNIKADKYWDHLKINMKKIEIEAALKEYLGRS